MTLPRDLSTAAAARAIDLINALGSLDGGAATARAETVTAVLTAWHDAIDDDLIGQIDEVCEVVAELAAIVGLVDRADAAEALNAMFHRHAGPPRLVHEPEWGWHLHVDRPEAGWPSWLASSSAMGLAALLSSRSGVPWGRCAAVGCERAFLDRGRRVRQRFCTDTCASRERVRRHRAQV